MCWKRRDNLEVTLSLEPQLIEWATNLAKEQSHLTNQELTYQDVLRILIVTGYENAKAK